MRSPPVAVLIAALASAATGCASSHGTSPATTGRPTSRPTARVIPPHPVTSAEKRARSAASGVLADWRAEVATQARENPGPRFRNPSRSLLRARVERAAQRYGLDVEGISVLHPRQQAPMVVLRSADPAAASRATGAIRAAIDPKRPTGDDRTGWAYEAFFLEEQDGSGVPFLAVFNTWRGRADGHDRGGGQWASSPGLYPFAHG